MPFSCLSSAFVLQLIVPGLVRAVYVRPNEISIERPYIERHIEATTVAFGLNRNATEQPFIPSAQGTVDPAQDSALLDNIRLWDLRAYNATITQIQALRPYYTFPDTDVDRYFINGHIKQVLLSPREIDVSQLSAEASQSWINPRFIYTHGFGVVVSEVNQITPDGLPVLLIENAPPEIKSPGFQLTRPEIYYGEKTQDPVFVHTAREEFDYPSGDQNKYSTYQGTGGFPVGSSPAENRCGHLRGRAQHHFHRLPHRREPHDDPPQRARTACSIWRASSLGPGPLSGDHRRWPAGVDGGRLHHFACCILIPRRFRSPV